MQWVQFLHCTKVSIVEPRPHEKFAGSSQPRPTFCWPADACQVVERLVATESNGTIFTSLGRQAAYYSLDLLTSCTVDFDQKENGLSSSVFE